MTEANNKSLYQSIKEEFQNLFALAMDYPKDGQKEAISFVQVADMVVVHLDTTPESHFMDSGLDCVKDFKKTFLTAGLSQKDIQEDYAYIPAGLHHTGAVTPTFSSTIPKASVHGRPIKNLKSSMMLTLSCSQKDLDLVRCAYRLALYKKAHAELTKAHKKVEALVAMALPQEERGAFIKNVLNAQGLGKLRDLGLGISRAPSAPSPNLG